MVSKVIILLSVVVVCSAIPSAPAGWTIWDPSTVAAPNPGTFWMPPWVASAPWYPKWSPCTTVGATCIDCTTKAVCTKIGSIQKPCSDPTMPYCNLGECSATPSAECAPEEAPAEQVGADSVV